MGRLTTAVVAIAVALGATATDYATIKRKFSQIDKGLVKPGAAVSINSRELNAYVEKELPAVAPPGVRSPRVTLGDGWAEGKALIDFLKLRKAMGAPEPNWLLRSLLEGEHEVVVRTRVESGNGQAQVEVERVEIAGLPISGPTLNYLMRHYVLPKYPNAKIGKPFELGYGIDRLDVRPGEVRIIMGAAER